MGSESIKEFYDKVCSIPRMSGDYTETVFGKRRYRISENEVAKASRVEVNKIIQGGNIMKEEVNVLRGLFTEEQEIMIINRLKELLVESGKVSIKTCTGDSFVFEKNDGSARGCVTISDGIYILIRNLDSGGEDGGILAHILDLGLEMIVDIIEDLGSN